MSNQTNIFARIAGAAAALFGKKAFSPAQWLRGGESSSGTSLANPLQQSVWVYACVTTLAECISGIPYRILNGAEGKTGGAVAPHGPAAELFARPHPQLDRFQFWELIVSWLMLRGECFVVATTRQNEVVRLDSRKAKVQRLHVLSPDRFREVVQNNELAGWLYTASSLDATLGTAPLLPEEVIHVKLPNPFNIWRGMSPLQVAMLAAQTDYNAALVMKGVMGNNADQGLVVRTEQTLGDDHKTQLVAALMQRKRSAGVADRPLILDGGLDVVKPTLSSADLQLLENRKVNRQEVCAVFKVSQEIIGYTEDANRSVADAMRLGFYENRIAPLCRRLEAGMDRAVQAVEPGRRGEFHVKGTPIMQAAQRARVETGVKAFSIGATFNEINETYDLGFEDKPGWGNKSYLPYSLQEAGAEPEAEPTPAPKKDDEIERALKFFSGLSKTVAKPAVCKASPQFEQSTAASVNLKFRKLRKFFREQQARVVAKLPTVFDTTGKSIVTRGIDDLLNVGDEDSALWKTLKPALKFDLEFGGSQLMAEYGLGEFALKPETAMKWLAQREDLITGTDGIVDNAFDHLKVSLQEGLGKGESLNALSDRVKEHYNAMEGKARTIATTETNVAVNSGRMEGIRESGLQYKGWLTSKLENTRASHLAAEQQGGVPVEEAFSNGLMHPGDPAGMADEVINCRCHLIALSAEGKALKSSGKLLRFEKHFEGKDLYALAA